MSCNALLCRELCSYEKAGSSLRCASFSSGPITILVSEERIARHLEKYAFDVHIRLVLLRPSGSYVLCCNQRN